MKSRKPTAIKASASLALLFIASLAGAAPIGTVTDLDGALLVTRANGSIKVLALNSEIEQGDILASRNQTYATLTLADETTVTLGPDTNLTLERYVYYKHTPDNDGAQFALARGSVRITAGLLGTRSGDTFILTTPTAILNIRGASLVAHYVVPEQAKVARRDTMPRQPRALYMVAVRYAPVADPGAARTGSDSNTLRLAQISPAPLRGGLAPGLYVHVTDGLIQMSNVGGTQNFTAGQFGYTANTVAPPVIVPSNPALKFTPPPTFSSTVKSPGTTAGSKANSVDCEVR